MLGRSANNIYWMFRYLERAENYARLIDTGFRMALTRDKTVSSGEWRSVIVTAGLQPAFEEKYGRDDYSGPNVYNFILRDPDNHTSVLAILEMARNNARGVRAAITRELWEAVNESWMTVRDALRLPVRNTNLNDVLDLIRHQTTQVRGAMLGGMLRNDIFNFGRIGQFLERADNTARIVDVKYYVLLPSLSYVGSSLDNVQWETILRSLGAERAYRWLNAGQMDARGIVDFLVLDGRFPRSLSFCYEKLRANLGNLALQYGGEVEAHELMRGADVALHDQTVSSIFEQGLHEFLTGFVAQNQRIAAAIQHDYRFVE
ncbi:alpha-E domain-containing protein [Croceicoccus sp. YJ47]|uniref:alpha-E domain-containing protein n=1 Tax=Croceicoccus sp. YJ47 TaxID=2798724 RepID=UPI001921EF7F|nr:alpha-E domain-containing protein [Croceicoccus sp. YJ47]QQN74427.1 alpha-E domain-containing protein [Croceicoccus sp. YJ47]